MHAGGDVDASNSWRAGLSYLQTAARDRDYLATDLAGNDAQLSFSGRSQLAIADFVWKWAPNGNAIDTQLQACRASTSGGASAATSPTTPTARSASRSTGNYGADQSGFYVQGVWQFMPTWRVGARYDWLDPGTVNYGANGVYLANGSFNPQRMAAMLDWTPSEFSRFRVQFQQAKLRPDLTDNELFVQYILTLGAHGAHKF